MDIYLPIAAISLDVFVLLGLGAIVGFLSGVFGVGGGFLLTPFLIFIGVPHAIAVASSANQLVGASVSGALAHWRRGNLDLQMAFVMLAGGFAGSAVGVWIFGVLRRIGQIDLAISLAYVLLLGTLGTLMLVESTRAILPGTSLFQIIFVAASVTVLQSIENGTVDVVLALVLLVGGVIGAQLGTRFGTKLRGEQLRALLALLVLAIAMKLVVDLTVRPDDPYAIEAVSE